MQPNEEVNYIKNEWKGANNTSVAAANGIECSFRIKDGKITQCIIICTRVAQAEYRRLCAHFVSEFMFSLLFFAFTFCLQFYFYFALHPRRKKKQLLLIIEWGQISSSLLLRWMPNKESKWNLLAHIISKRIVAIFTSLNIDLFSPLSLFVFHFFYSRGNNLGSGIAFDAHFRMIYWLKNLSNQFNQCCGKIFHTNARYIPYALWIKLVFN